MKIYISGKISGLPREIAKKNFDDAENKMKKIYPNAKVVNPMRSFVPRWASWGVHMVFDLLKLRSCTHIHLMDGWVDSPGAVIEYAYSRKRGIKLA